MNGTGLKMITNPHSQDGISSGADSGSDCGSGSGTIATGSCSQRYTGRHCLSALKSLQECLFRDDTVSDIFISSNIADQLQLEDEIGNLLFSLELFIKPSEECRSRVIPFFCLYTFGLCGENGVNYHPTATQCSDIRDKVCESEWKEANLRLESVGRSVLPDCSSFSDRGLEDMCNKSKLYSPQHCCLGEIYFTIFTMSTPYLICLTHSKDYHHLSCELHRNVVIPTILVMGILIVIYYY